MGISFTQFLPLFVCLGFATVLGFFYLMYRWARKRKGAAMAFGMLVVVIMIVEFVITFVLVIVFLE